MAFTPEDIEKNRQFFIDKLRAERQKADVVRWQKKEPNAPDFLLLDVRTRDAYAAGHIAGALCVPLVELNDLISQLPKDRTLVAYCWNDT